MGNPLVITKQLAAADADAIATSQTLGAAGDLTLDGVLVSGGVATLDTLRRVLITSAGNDSGITFTVFGTIDGTPFQETVTGANIGTVATTLDFETVTRISASGATAADVEAGTNGVGATRWHPTDYGQVKAHYNFSLDVTDTIDVTIEYTLHPDPTGVANRGKVPTDVAAFNVSGSVLTNATSDVAGTFEFPITAWRALVNSGTGSVKVTALQQGV